MRAVKGYTKHDYILFCKETGGEAFGFETLKDAAEYFRKFYIDLTERQATEMIETDLNGDWILFDDGSVIFEYYGKYYNEDVTDEMREKGYNE